MKKFIAAALILILIFMVSCGGAEVAENRPLDSDGIEAEELVMSNFESFEPVDIDFDSITPRDITAIYSRVSDFSEELAAVALDSKWGYINRTGNEVVTPQFDEVRRFRGGMAAVRTGDKWGFIHG